MNITKKLIVLLINLAIMAIIVILLIWGTMIWLKTYTRKSEVMATPNLIGLSIDDAQGTLNNDELTLLITDSVYNPDAKPGTIIDTSPKPQAMIKKGRTIYATINALSVMDREIPKVHEVSLRQAEAMLKAIGFKDITLKYVFGTYNDLVLNVLNSNNEVLTPGTKVPFTTPLILEVSTNDSSLCQSDSLSVDSASNPSNEEEWF